MAKKTIEIPDGFELVQVDEHNYKIVKKNSKLPKSWSEFCENYPYISGESYIQSNCCISELASGPRSFAGSMNVLPNKEYAEAILALCQLIQLRDCYRQGWEPNYSTKNAKYVITYWEGSLIRDRYSNRNVIFSFQTEELRDKFYWNFKDLIEKTKPLFI